jgi:hypothetical protein
MTKVFENIPTEFKGGVKKQLLKIYSTKTSTKLNLSITILKPEKMSSFSPPQHGISKKNNYVVRVLSHVGTSLPTNQGSSQPTSCLAGGRHQLCASFFSKWPTCHVTAGAGQVREYC